MEFSFKNHLSKKRFSGSDLKAVLFDMDGVLYNSMPAHAQSWQETMNEFGFKTTSPEEFYYHEGRVGASTINLIMRREKGRDATEEEIQTIYSRKSELFAKYNRGDIIPGIKEVIRLIQSYGLKTILVTGSGQPSLLDRLDINFPGVFTPETMVTAFDVKEGKPSPEPYLEGLKKDGNLKPNQAITLENAPLGVQSSVAAGIFTIAINTGPLSETVLWDAGADIVLDSMDSLRQFLPLLFSTACTPKMTLQSK